MAMNVQQTMSQWSFGWTRIRWGAIMAGLFTGMTTQMILTLLGLAVGAWSINLQESQPVQGVPIGTGIWTGISMLIAAFVGGYIAARMGGVSLQSDGIYHGIVVWAVNWFVLAWLATTAMSFLIGGVFNAFGSAVQALSRGVGAAVSQAAGAASLNISMEDLRRQVESVLAATGKPELQPGEVRKDVGQIAGQARGGRPLSEVAESAWMELQQKLTALDRDAAINVLVNRFGVSEPQAREVVRSTIGMVGPIQQAVHNVREQSVDIANRAISTIGSAAWWLFLLGLLTLGLSAWGGALGISEAPPAAATGEVYGAEARRTAG